MFSLDIFDRSDGSLFSVVLDVTLPDDLGSVSGGGSEYSLAVPLTQNNRIYFEDWQRPSSFAPNAPTMKDFQLTYGGAACRRGKIMLRDASQDTINVVLLFDNQNILKALNGVLLRELPWESRAVATVGGTISWGTVEADDSCTFPVKWRKWRVGTTYRYATIDDVWIGYSVLWLFRYAMRRIVPMPEIVSTIVSYEYGTGFFNQLILGINPHAGYDENYFRDLLGLRASHDFGLIEYNGLPIFTGYPVTAAQCQKLDQLINVTDAPNFNISGSYDIGTQTYTAPIAARYKLRIVIGYNDWDYDPPTWGTPPPNAGFLVFYRLNGSTFANFLNPTGTGVATGTFKFINAGSYESFEVDVTLDAGDTLEFYFRIQTIALAYSVRMNQCYLEVYKDQTYVAGEPIIAQGMIPERMTVLEAMRGVMNALNLRMYYYEATNQVFIEPEHDWIDYGDTSQTGFVSTEVDWTDRIDVGREVKVLPAREMLDVTFEYDAAQDATLAELDKQRQLKAANGQYLTGRNDAQPKVIKLPFTKLNHIIDSTIRVAVDAGGTEYYPSVQLPLFYPTIHNNDPDTDEEFRSQVIFLAFAGTNIYDESIALYESKIRTADAIDTGAPALMACSFNYVANYSDFSNTKRWPNLEFSDGTAPDGSLQVGLIKRYWLPTLSSLRRGKRIVVGVKSSVLDWLTLDFRKFIRFGAVKYVLEQFKIKQGSGDLSEATLRQYHHPTEDDAEFVAFSEVPTVVIYDPEP